MWGMPAFVAFVIGAGLLIRSVFAAAVGFLAVAAALTVWRVRSGSPARRTRR